VIQAAQYAIDLARRPGRREKLFMSSGSCNTLSLQGHADRDQSRDDIP
jgi:hypothetical protein